MQEALREIYKKSPQDIDRVTSDLLDSLPDLSAQDKAEMTGTVEGLAVNSVQGAIWGSMAAALLFLIIFNFARGFNP
jgi:hypothetical protein